MSEQKGIESPDKGVSSQNLIEKSTEEETHKEETHGKSDDIDESTPVDKVKGPSVFQRAKEEVEALVETVLPKK